jgi:hypothetical protein
MVRSSWTDYVCRVYARQSSSSKRPRARLRDMQTRAYWDHVAPDGRNFTDIVRNYYRGEVVGECLFNSSPASSADTALKLLLESPSHRQIPSCAIHFPAVFVLCTAPPLTLSTRLLGFKYVGANSESASPRDPGGALFGESLRIPRFSDTQSTRKRTPSPRVSGHGGSEVTRDRVRLYFS